MNVGEPTTMLGLAAVAVVTVGGWIKAWIDGHHHVQAVEGVKDQLTNGHGTNLRDDLDEFRADVQAGFDDMRRDMRGIRQDVGGVRGELRDERQARIDLGRRIDDYLR